MKSFFFEELPICVKNIISTDEQWYHDFRIPVVKLPIIEWIEFLQSNYQLNDEAFNELFVLLML